MRPSIPSPATSPSTNRLISTRSFSKTCYVSWKPHTIRRRKSGWWACARRTSSAACFNETCWKLHSTKNSVRFSRPQISCAKGLASKQYSWRVRSNPANHRNHGSAGSSWGGRVNKSENSLPRHRNELRWKLHRPAPFPGLQEPQDHGDWGKDRGGRKRRLYPTRRQ